MWYRVSNLQSSSGVDDDDDGGGGPAVGPVLGRVYPPGDPLHHSSREVQEGGVPGIS